MSRGNSRRPWRPVLITGGSGFIGTNQAHRVLSTGRPVLLFDSLARPGVEQNLRWLHDTHGQQVEIEIADTRNAEAVRRAVDRAAQVFHSAGPAAVTSSLTDPLEDFEVNARGTLTLLEAIRAQPTPPPLVFASTNKVYGNLPGLELVEEEKRYLPADAAVLQFGISETQPLSFHSPYGCSKGT